jgi:antitoxin (DNA-binding transcriptional repressor) of toxin-antitoxin stability system
VLGCVWIQEAQADLPTLIARAEAGEEIVIARGEEPAVRLTPVAVRTGRREPGLLKGKYDLPDEFFFDPLPEEELRLWEGAEDEGAR